MSEVEEMDQHQDIAVIGVAGRFPGARTPDEFWYNLVNGVESITLFDDDELEPGDEVSQGSILVKAAGLLEGVELFDASFFGMSPREAQITDPQQRIFLECAWEALENSGYDPAAYDGRIGVYAGAGTSDYLIRNVCANPDVVGGLGSLQVQIGNDRDHLATRVSYKLGLTGPSVSVQTACSTSLVAVHLACESLLNYQCDMALAGGISIKLPQKAGYLYQDGGITSPDGHCRAFDAKAQGTVFSSGVGIVVLKRLAAAIADRDSIYAVVKGSAINNDGASKVGYSAPGVEGQSRVIAEALAVAGIDPDSVSYIETHGSGTNLGDPIEIAALTQAFRASTNRKGFCAIGSVKTNIGHLVAAAGIASLIKVVFALKHKQLPATLHYNTPNSQIDFAQSPFFVNSSLTEWKSANPRRAGVSSFGVGGTNAHAVLEEAPETDSSEESEPLHLLTISAKTATALDSATANLLEHLKRNPDLNIADVAGTLQAGRRQFAHRRTLVCGSTRDAIDVLETANPVRLRTQVVDGTERPVAFMFTGQGSQYVNMGRGLYESVKGFKEDIDRCAELLRAHLNIDLRKILYPDAEEEEWAKDQLNQTRFTQAAVFVVEYCLARLWIELGVQPQALIGHSLGEYVAACLAGVFSLEDALALVSARGRLMQEVSTGSMVAVSLGEQETMPLLKENLSLAAVNSASLCVVSGAVTAVQELERDLQRRDVRYTRLLTSHAFHSEMMDPVLDAFTDEVGKIELSTPRIPFISNLSGTWITDSEATDPRYWTSHLRNTVRFAKGIQELFQDDRILLEVGPGETLSSIARQSFSKSTNGNILSSLGRQRDPNCELETILSTLGRLWLNGAQINWQRSYPNRRRRRVPLPTYPFERQRFWLEPKMRDERMRPASQDMASNKLSAISNWFYVPVWKQSPPARAVEPTTADSWSLLFEDVEGVGRKLTEELERKGQRIISVRKGTRFNKTDDTCFSINPGDPDDYDLLLTSLRTEKKEFRSIIHLWNTSRREASGITFFCQSQETGFYSLLYLLKAVGRCSFAQQLQLDVVSNHTQQVTGIDVVLPEKATILGLCVVAQQMRPNLTCRSIDIALSEADAPLDKRIINALASEFVERRRGSVIAYRGSQRWVQDFERFDSGSQLDTPLKQRGVYLITGGLGNIGFEIAKYLARTVNARLVLVGRSVLPDRKDWEKWLKSHGDGHAVSRKIRIIRTLEELGAEVLPVSADVGNRQDVETAILLAEKEFGKIAGVIHAAGDVGDGTFKTIEELDRDACELQFRSKVYGLLNLSELFAGKQLDFCVLASSLATVLGGRGLASYSAANSFMNAFAERRRNQGEWFWTSLNWDAWKFETEGENDSWLESSFRGVLAEFAMTPQEGVETFRCALSMNAVSNLVISTGELVARRSRWLTSGSQPIQGPKTNRLVLPATVSAKGRDAEANGFESKLVRIWGELIGVGNIGLDDDFFELGGDSLLAVSLFAKIKEISNADFGLATLFEAPTVRKLAALIEKKTCKNGKDVETSAAWTSLVPIQPKGSKPPFFCIHGFGGNVVEYSHLTRHLDPDRPFYGLQAQGLDGRKPRHNCVEEMAAHYIKEIRELQSEGPYYLGGSSFGGMVAYEMAQQLTAIGERVGLLALFDTHCPGYPKLLPKTTVLRRRINSLKQRVDLHAGNIKLMRPDERLEYVAEKSAKARKRFKRAWKHFRRYVGQRFKEILLPKSLRLQFRLTGEDLSQIKFRDLPTWLPRQIRDVQDAGALAAMKYVPKPYGGRVTLFRASEQPLGIYPDSTNGWGGLTIGGLDVHEVPGYHGAIIREPRVRVLAEKLNVLLEAVQPNDMFQEDRDRFMNPRTEPVANSLWHSSSNSAS